MRGARGAVDGHVLRNGTNCSGIWATGLGEYYGARVALDPTVGMACMPRHVMMSMGGTYFGSNLTKNEKIVDLELKQGVSLTQLAVGVGSIVIPGCATKLQHPNANNWTEARLNEFVGCISGKGMTQLGVWRVDISA